MDFITHPKKGETLLAGMAIVHIKTVFY